MYRHIYLDLDRTLLDTPRFSDAVIRAFEQEYHVQATEFQGQMSAFYVHHDAMQYYDFFGHVASLGHDPQEVIDKIRPKLADGDFIYPDAQLLLAKLRQSSVNVSILSYGPENYQGFKYSLFSVLQDLPFVATLQFKQEYLAGQSPLPSLLVDDREVAPLPSWCTQFLIDRSAVEPKIRLGEQLWRINSLQEVETALSLRYNEPNQKGITDEAD